MGMSPTLERLNSKQFFPSNPPHDPPFTHHPTGLSVTSVPANHQKGNAPPTNGPRTENANISETTAWPSYVDPTLAPHSPYPPSGLLRPLPAPSQPRPGPSQPQQPAGRPTVHWGPSITYRVDGDVIGSSGADQPTQTSKHQSRDCDEEPNFADEDREPPDIADEDSDMPYGGVGASDSACFVSNLAASKTCIFCNR